MTTMTASMRAAARKRDIRQNYPHQVALPDWLCTRENFDVVERYCAAHFDRRPATTMIEARWQGGAFETMRLYCFVRALNAQSFAAHFDGEHFDHKVERDGKRTYWPRPGHWAHRIRYGPLSVPRWLRENP